MASSDLLIPIFWTPWNLSFLHTNYLFLIGGQLGQALCKLVPFFGAVSLTVSIQNLILIAVDRFGAVVLPLRSPLIRSKLSLLHSHHVDSCRSFQFARLVHLRARWIPRGNQVCFKMEESIWRALILCQFRTSFLHSVYRPISIKVASEKNDAWSMFHSPRCIIVATLVNYVPATSLET